MSSKIGQFQLPIQGRYKEWEKGLHNVGGLLQRPLSKAQGVRSKLDIIGEPQLSGVPLGKSKDMPHVGGLL